MSRRTFKEWLWRARYKVGIWGYLVEGFSHLRGLFSRRMAPNRFVIFAQGRSGSELLRALLNAHSQIHCDAEILVLPVFFPERLIQCRARLWTRETYGFKVKISQLIQRQKVRDVKTFLTRLHEGGWKILYLSRRNLLRHALSGFVRTKTGRSHRYHSKDDARPKVGKMSIDCELLMRRMQWRKANLADEEDALRGLPCLRVVYDDDLYSRDQQKRTLERVFTWLGLDHEDVTSDLVRITPKRLRDLIANYDEVVGAIAGTEFEPFLDEPPKMSSTVHAS